MAKKDFDEYFNEICSQYINMKKQIELYEESLSKSVMSPEDIERIRNNLQMTITPLMSSYKTLSYVKYLLDLPVKK